MKIIANNLFFCFLSLFLVDHSLAQTKFDNTKDLSKINKEHNFQSIKELPIEVSADKVSQDTTKNLVHAKGRVIVRYGQKMVRADKLKINVETGQGEAIGNVTLFYLGTLLKA